MKFHSIRIQNYKSINDITLYLSDVNLLIGPNNSGKSNILSALKLFSDYVYFLRHNEYPIDWDFSKDGNFNQKKEPIVIFESDFSSFTLTYISEDLKYFNLHVSINSKKEHSISKQLFRISNQGNDVELSNLIDIIEKSEYLEVDGFNIKNNQEYFTFEQSYLFQKKVNVYSNYSKGFTHLIKVFTQCLLDEFFYSSIYNIHVEKLRLPARLNAHQESILPDGSNLVSFIDSMRDTIPSVIQEIENDLFHFTKEFTSIRLIKVTGDSTTEATFKKLGLADKDNNTFWSNQLSEGVLYLLALLAIIHQPYQHYPLMLEEPEKGIHPRRIKEIIELIFQIAKDKGIRIILTTHSTYVVDQFTEFPEGVHIVDKIDKSTQVKNLKRDFIDKEEGREDKIDYLSSLGEHWAIGFLGGVPE